MEDFIGRLSPATSFGGTARPMALQEVGLGRPALPAIAPTLAIICETGYATFVLSHATREGSSLGKSDEGTALRL
jgi:hypothetical protein